MYTVKQIPEDFIVEEVPDIKLSRKGDYTYFTIEKKNWNTRDVIAELARRVGVNENRFNIAGMKDKNAITKQAASAYKIPQSRIAKIKIKDVKFNFIGRGDDRIKLGQIKENKFIIIVRNLDDRKYNEIDFIENYFDEQRFSISNIEVGRYLVKKEFHDVCNSLNLQVTKNDFIGTIRKNIPKKMLVFYINAYQSFIFNQALCSYIASNSKDFFEVAYEQGKFIFSRLKIENKKIPIIGFLSVIRDKTIKRIYDSLLAKEGISKDDFLFPMLPELSSEGNERDLILDVDPSIKFSNDELNEGKLKATLMFSLKKGAYATMVVKKMFGS